MKQFDKRLIIAAIGMTLAATGSWAQTAAPATSPAPATPAPSVSAPQVTPAPGTDMPHPGTGMKGPQSMGHPHGMSEPHDMGQLPKAVIDQLALSPAQKAQLDTAQASRQEMRAARQAAMAARQKTMTEQLAKEQMDPRAILATNKQARHDMELKQEAVEQKWLAFWDGLSAEQHKTLTSYMRTRHEKQTKKHTAAPKG
jgi:uncharacterized membrane protein